MTESKYEYIKEILESSPIVLFMKGTLEIPQCGFSAMTVAILKKLDIGFRDIDVLQDMNLREDIKEYSDWPTIPQLYIKGEFIGGCDIVKQLYLSGQLREILSKNNLLK